MPVEMPTREEAIRTLKRKYVPTEKQIERWIKKREKDMFEKLKKQNKGIELIY